MANLTDLYNSLLAEVKEISAFKFVAIWNNQLEQLQDGLTYAFPFPNAFIEILTPTDYLPLGGGYSITDYTVRIHIGHEQYDAGGGNFEQNIEVFNYRDLVIAKLNGFQPTGGSSLMKNAEIQDYTHTNVYHYQIDFRGNFVDAIGNFIDKGDDVTGEITDVIFSPIGDPDPRANVDVAESITGQKNEDYREYKIN
jgi:hypothetical protein